MKQMLVFLVAALVGCSALAQYQPSSTMQRRSMNAQERESCGRVARRLDAAEAEGDEQKIADMARAVDQCMAALEPYTRPAEVRAREEKREQDATAEREAKQRAVYAADQFSEEVALSGAVCAYEYLRKSSKDEIAAEKKYAAEGGGIVNMQKLYTLQGRMRLGTEGVARLQPRIASPLACEGNVLAVANCVANVNLTREIPPDPICNSKTSLWAYQQ